MNDEPLTPLTPGERKLERSKRKFDKAWKWAVRVSIGLALIIGYTVGFHDITKQDASSASCKALDKSIQIQEKFVRHLERKSIQNVEAGVTSSTTSIPEIHRFFIPTIEEIERTHC